jgi:hypothetical protein
LFGDKKMALPIWEPHPRGWQNPVNARVSAVLPAAGAWDAAPTEFFTSGAHTITIQFTYTRGAAGGAFDFQLEASVYSIAALVPAGGVAWANETAMLVGAVAIGVDTQSQIQQEYITYGSQAGGAETIIVGPIPLMGTVERIRIPARESADGVIITPGTLQITVELF